MTVTPDTATRHESSYDPPQACFERWCVAMERLLLLWDEIDDLLGTSRYMVRNKAMAFWSSVRKR